MDCGSAGRGRRSRFNLHHLLAGWHSYGRNRTAQLRSAVAWHRLLPGTDLLLIARIYRRQLPERKYRSAVKEGRIVAGSFVCSVYHICFVISNHVLYHTRGDRIEILSEFEAATLFIYACPRVVAPSDREVPFQGLLLTAVGRFRRRWCSFQLPLVLTSPQIQNTPPGEQELLFPPFRCKLGRHHQICIDGRITGSYQG
jgi:hypothetical protein